jgi:hypothetical protein
MDAEMAPWSIGGEYDRPIPRRIVEEAGVERDSFGQSKKAVAVWYGKEESKNIMKDESIRDFESFCKLVSGPQANRCVLWGITRTMDRYSLA